jgi:hypothetical protein
MHAQTRVVGIQGLSRLCLVIVVFSLFPSTQPPKHSVLLFQPSNLSSQLLLALALALQCRPCIIGYSSQSGLPLGMLQAQLHAYAALFFQKPLVVFVQGQDRRCLIEGVRTQLIQQQSKRVFVVGEERLERRIGRGKCRKVVLRGRELGLEMGYLCIACRGCKIG